MMDLTTADQVEQDQEQRREEVEHGSSPKPDSTETSKISELEDSKPQDVQDSGGLLWAKEEDQQEDKVPAELLKVNSSSHVDTSSTGKFVTSSNIANGMKLPQLVSLKLGEVKDEPPEQKNDNVLTSSASTTGIKSEPGNKENLKISSVYSLRLNPGTVGSLPTDGSTNIAGTTPTPTFQQEPSAQSSARCLTCSQCMKVLVKGQRAYQLKSSKEVFCSTSCLSAMPPRALTRAPPAPTTTKKNCLYCLKVIDQAQGSVLAPGDNVDTLRDFCGPACFSTFDNKKKTIASIFSTKTQLGPPVTQTLCSICNKPCIRKCEVILNGAAYKMCGDACFGRFCAAHDMTVVQCESCGTFCKTKPLILKMEDGNKMFCNDDCLDKFKKRTKAATQCAMCSIMSPLSDMLCSKDIKSNMKFFCTSICETAFQIQAITASAPVPILPSPTSAKPIPVKANVVLGTSSSTGQPSSLANTAPQVSTVALPNVQEKIVVQVMPTSSKPMEFQDVNSVNSLQKYPFVKRTLDEQMRIKELGPHRPDLNIQQRSSNGGRAYVRAVSRSHYDKNRWLTGCEQSNAYFCFPCLLFSSVDTEELWTKSGVKDLKHLSEKCKRHENTPRHLDSSMKLSFLGRLSITEQLNRGYKIGIRSHNEEVTKNRHILSKIIDCMKFCGSFELFSHGHDEKKTSDNNGIFHGLVDFVASFDGVLKEHLEKDTVFKGTSEMVQNELLECMLSVVREHIIKEVQSNDFLSIQADEAIHVATQSQLVLVLRYIDDKRNLQERFFECIPLKSANVESIATALKERLAAILPENQRSKLICQAYTGFGALRSATASVQKKIQDVYPNAHYIHCYAHRLDQIMQQATSPIAKVRVFFSELDGLASFFSGSPKRTCALDKVVAKKPKTSNDVGLDFDNHAIDAVFEHGEDLRRCFENIRYSGDFDSNTIREAGIYITVLETEDFKFFLQLFHAIMPHVDLLYAKLQERNVNSVHITECIQQFQQGINAIRKNYIHTTIEDRGDSQPRKRQRTLGPEEQEKIASKVFDIILKHTKERFAFTDHLVSATLLHSDMFEKHNISFPDDALDDTLKAFPMLHRSKLRKELSLIYSKEEFRACRGALDLYQLFMENDLEEVFSETVTLLKILITIPMTTKEENRCFSTSDRVKTFLRNTVAQKRLNALAMLSMEKKLVAGITDFNQKVIEKFAAQKERRATFMFK